VTAKGRPADPAERFHQLELQVTRLARTLREVNEDEELRSLLVSETGYRFDWYNFAILTAHLTYECRRLFEFMEGAYRADAEEGAGLGDMRDERGFVVVTSGVPQSSPNRVRPVREVWPLCRHDDPASPGHVDASARRAPGAHPAGGPAAYLRYDHSAGPGPRDDEFVGPFPDPAAALAFRVEHFAEGAPVSVVQVSPAPPGAVTPEQCAAYLRGRL
jgi:hypothetical protein